MKTFVLIFLLNFWCFGVVATAAIDYIDENRLPQLAPSATLITANKNTVTLKEGWYYVEDTVEMAKGIIVDGWVRIILTDGSALNSLVGGIRVNGTNKLDIYAQSGGSGKLTANNTDLGAGIGGDVNQDGGIINIYGGTITAKGGPGAAGIGGGGGGSAVSITITGGTVTAIGNSDAAGIGGGYSGGGGSVTITGGTVTATTEGSIAAGIGGGGVGSGGAGGDGCTVTVSGGTIKAVGGEEVVAGIGGGCSSGSGGCKTTGTLKNNKGEDVYLNNLTVGLPAVANTLITAGNIGGVGSYKLRDIATDEEGKVYFYLPASATDQEVTLTAGGVIFKETYRRLAAHGNNQVLTNAFLLLVGRIEDADYSDTQTNVQSREEAQAKVEAVVTSLREGLNIPGLSVTVLSDQFTAAAAGTSSSVDGVDGSYLFKVMVSTSEGMVRVTTQKRLTITAVAFKDLPCTERRLDLGGGSAGDWPCGGDEWCLQDVGGSPSECVTKCSNPDYTDTSVEANATGKCTPLACGARVAVGSSCGEGCLKLPNGTCGDKCPVFSSTTDSDGKCTLLSCESRKPQNSDCGSPDDAIPCFLQHDGVSCSIVRDGNDDDGGPSSNTNNSNNGLAVAAIVIGVLGLLLGVAAVVVVVVCVVRQQPGKRGGGESGTTVIMQEGAAGSEN